MASSVKVLTVTVVAAALALGVLLSQRVKDPSAEIGLPVESGRSAPAVVPDMVSSVFPGGGRTVHLEPAHPESPEPSPPTPVADVENGPVNTGAAPADAAIWPSPRAMLQKCREQLLTSPTVGVAYSAALEGVVMRLSFDGRYTRMGGEGSILGAPGDGGGIIRLVGNETRSFQFNPDDFPILRKLGSVQGATPGQRLHERPLEVGSPLWDELMAFLDESLLLPDS